MIATFRNVITLTNQIQGDNVVSVHSAGFTSRYAKALFQLAAEEGTIDAVVGDLTLLQKQLEESSDLTRAISSPLVSRDEQSKAMAALLQKNGAGDLVCKFIGVVASNGRLFALLQIISKFFSDLAEYRGEVTAEVISAQPLDKGLLSEVKKAVASIADSDKISLATRVDESLLGGLVVRVGSRMIDTSLRTKLNKLEITMKGIG